MHSKFIHSHLLLFFSEIKNSLIEVHTWTNILSINQLSSCPVCTEWETGRNRLRDLCRGTLMERNDLSIRLFRKHQPDLFSIILVIKTTQALIHLLLFHFLRRDLVNSNNLVYLQVQYCSTWFDQNSYLDCIKAWKSS